MSLDGVLIATVLLAIFFLMVSWDCERRQHWWSALISQTLAGAFGSIALIVLILFVIFVSDHPPNW